MARLRSSIASSLLLIALASCESASTEVTDTGTVLPDIGNADGEDVPDTASPEPDAAELDVEEPDTTVVVEPNIVEVTDQTITSKPPKLSARVTVEAFPKYLVIRNSGGDVIGSERIWQKGPADYDVSVDLPPSWTPAALTAELYEADGNEPKLDAPVTAAGAGPISVPFKATRPPKNSLTAEDQTLKSFGYKITVEEVDIEELPAWLAVYEDDAGAPGALLGALAVTTSPKVKLGVSLNRFVEPTETLWVAVHADLPADGAFTAADPVLLEAPLVPLRKSIVVTNESCDGLTTKFCDPAKPGVISWLDRCGENSTVTTSCGTGTCDDTGPYVFCRPAADPCGGNVAKTCVAADPHAVYWENACGVPTSVAFPCGAASLCDDSGPGTECATVPTCAGNATLSCEGSDPSRIFWRDHCGELNGDSIACGATSACDDTDGTATCVPDATCGGNTRLTCRLRRLGHGPERQ